MEGVAQWRARARDEGHVGLSTERDIGPGLLFCDTAFYGSRLLKVSVSTIPPQPRSTSNLAALFETLDNQDSRLRVEFAKAGLRDMDPAAVAGVGLSAGDECLPPSKLTYDL